jgi:hypothetical protein
MNPIIYKNLSFSAFIAIFLVFIITSCSSLDIVPNKTDRFKEMQEAKGNDPVESTPLTERFKKIFNENSGITFSKSITYEVALKQFSIMPLITIDKNSGAIITDWYSANSNKNERVKFNIFILDENMNSNSINIVMFKETFNGSTWIPATVDKSTPVEIKELILKKAMQLKAAASLS